MKSKASRPAIEIAVQWIAAASLGSAAGFAVARLAPAGPALVLAAAAGVVVAGLALFLLASIDRPRDGLGEQFAPADFPAQAGREEDVLLLDEPLGGTGELLLDDPLPSIDAESRVVRLFAAEPLPHGPTAVLPGPGEMVARIEDFLGLARGSAGAAEPAPRVGEAASADASAALHAALADIRRSLRHG